MQLRIAGMAFMLSAAVTSSATAQVALPFGSEDRTLSPYFEIEEGTGLLDRLPLEDTKVNVHVSGVIASVAVRQIYQNDGERPINARYVFPASTRAAVSGMRVRIGARVIEAVIREREQARREFEVAKSEGKTAALLEEHRPNVFEMGVANIMPGDRLEVELRYTELIVPTDGVYEFVYPTVVGPRYRGATEPQAPPGANAAVDRNVLGEGWASTPFMPSSIGTSSVFDVTATISAGMPIRELHVPSHRTRSEWTGRSAVHVTLEESEWSKGDRDFVLRYRLADDDVTSGLMLQEGTDENFFLLLVEPPKRVTPEHIPPREFVFVLDVSGSMSGFPLETAKGLLGDLVADLGEQDSFNVLLFAGSSRLMSESSIPATAANLATARRFIDDQRAGGGTELGQALGRAMSLPRSGPAARSLVLITDGFVTAEDAVFRMIRSGLDEANVFAFGIGSSVNRHLVEGVARAGMGEPFVVTEPAEAAAVVDRFRAYVTAPVLTDVRVDFDGFRGYGLEPAAIPDVFADRPLVIQGKWRGEARGQVIVEGVTGDGTYSRSFEVARIQTDRSDALPQLWARTRITNLSDQALSGRGDSRRAEILDLGLRYNLLTKYTSFVAVDRIVRNEGRATDVDQPQPVPHGTDPSAVGGRVLAVGPEPELWILCLMVLLLLGSRGMMRPAAIRNGVRDG